MASSVLQGFKATAVNGKVTGTTQLIPAMAGWWFIPLGLVARKRAETGASGSPVMSVGNDSPDYDNIQDALFMAGTIPDYLITTPPVPDTGQKTIDLTNAVYLNITSASGSTTLTLDVFLFGILFQ
jgi:hypothetical protein